jgi:hypothetical protein
MSEPDRMLLANLLGTEEELPAELVETYDRYVSCRHRQIGGRLEVAELMTVIMLSGADQIVKPPEPLSSADWEGFEPLGDRTLAEGAECMIEWEGEQVPGTFFRGYKDNKALIRVPGEEKSRPVPRSDVWLRKLEEPAAA